MKKCFFSLLLCLVGLTAFAQSDQQSETDPVITHYRQGLVAKLEI